MAEITPSIIFPNMTSDGTNITIPISDINGLNASEAEPSSGDGRKFMANLIETFSDQLDALTASARPDNFTLVKNSMVRRQGDNYNQTYTITVGYDVDPSDLTLIPEL